MKISNKIANYLLVTTLIVAVSACKSSQKKVTIGDGALVDKDRKEILTDALNSELKYKSISGKVTIELKAGKKSTKTGSFVKIIKDSVIQLSVRPLLGIEAFRLTLTPSSIQVVDRMNKKYAQEDIKILQEKAHFNFYNLQALFTNALFLPDHKSVKTADFKQYQISKANNMYMAGTEKNGVTYNFAIDASNRIASTLIYDKNKNTVQWSYSDFVKEGENIYPTNMLAKIEAQNKRFDVGMSFSSLDINKNIDVDYSVSSKYQKIAISEIIKAYIK